MSAVACTKIRYRDRLAADFALADTARKAKRNGQHAQKRRELRAYECPDCSGWHLTSEPERASA